MWHKWEDLPHGNVGMSTLVACRREVHAIDGSHKSLASEGLHCIVLALHIKSDQRIHGGSHLFDGYPHRLGKGALTTSHPLCPAIQIDYANS